jgi:hypothetical protein
MQRNAASGASPAGGPGDDPNESMETPAQGTSLPFAIVFWFLAVVTISFVLLAAWRTWSSASQSPFEVAVESRRVNVVVRDVRESKSRRIVPRSYVEYRLALVRPDTGRTTEQTEQTWLSEAELVSLEFLDRYTPGTRLQVIEERDKPSTFDLEPGKRWFAVVGILFAAWMFGTFAWIVRPFATRADEPGGRIYLKFLSFAALLVAVVVFVVLDDRRTKGGKESRPRVAVEGYSKRLTSEEFVADLRASGVDVEDRVAQRLGESVRFSEYEYGGRTWRTTSLDCQPPEGQPCPGRLNPDNPRDVKWGGEP